MVRATLVAFVGLAASIASGDVSVAQSRPESRLPNFIVIFTDDQGYGDLGSFGHPTIRTPHLDRMAAEGQRWTSFYAAASVCTPSRAGLLTARLPVRSGMTNEGPGGRRVLFPDSAGGLPGGEITIAEALKPRGYATAAIGKWHLGHLPEHLPMRHGFDSYFGVPYSNDMDWAGGNVPNEERRHRMMNPKIEYWNVPLMRNDTIVERPAGQSTLTRRYTDEAIAFLRRNRDRPFFLYVAHSMPHMPLFPSRHFEGKSLRGRYGDVIEEIDSNVGRLLATVRELQLDRRTLVVFTSDNGPWAIYDQQGGSAGVLRGAKGGTFEGGMRVPAIFWWPGTIPSGVVTDIGSTLDLLPTFAKLAGAEAPRDRELDGHDLTAALRGTGRSPRETMFYYRGSTVYAVRHGSFKAHFFTKSEYGSDAVVPHHPPLLYNLDHDPAEKFDVAKQHPGVVAEIERIAAAHKATVRPVPNQLEPRIASDRTR
jgi:arylsulfatase A-like enzyme